MGTRSLITLDTLQGLLQDTEPDVVVESFEMEAGSGRGDNYTAMLYRVRLRGQRRGADWDRSVICKVLPSSARQREAYKSDALFRNEVAFYTRALPALQQFEEHTAAAPHFTATPRCYRAQDTLVVLEDLRDRGFIMADRRQGLDVTHLRLILSEVAHFHALSLAMKALEPETFSREVAGTIRETQFLAENENWYRDYYRTACNNVMSMVRDGLPDGEERSRCLEATSSFLMDSSDEEGGTAGTTGSFFKRMVALVEPVEPLAVLCHGDCWTNNFLFRYHLDGHAEEVMLLDFQMSRYGSPCLDLVLLLYCCTEQALRDGHLDALLRHYHAALAGHLERLGCTPRGCSSRGLPLPPYADPDQLWQMLQSDMQRLGRFGLGQAVDYIPCLCCDSEEAPNVYDAQGDGEQAGEPAGGGGESNQERGQRGPLPAPTLKSVSARRVVDLIRELVRKGDL